ncbi:GNAT family N-acetyltransferase [Halomarina pelagica]|uniref:GNAT family N-acetyltransferase n=1 Tax=Halomarina pelagica TaxID=2961599 RepID=UPI0020C42C76|nr:GNAT family N-acetyltransferase [Halomarina sp. BND7]
MTDAIREATTEREERDAVALLKQLFGDLDDGEVRAFFDDDAYRAFCLYEGDAPVAVAGVSVRPVLHHERHVWLHDLVVEESRRGEGRGARLLAFVEDWARERGCDLAALAARKGNDGARRFYERSGYEPWGTVYERRLSEGTGDR